MGAEAEEVIETGASHVSSVTNTLKSCRWQLLALALTAGFLAWTATANSIVPQVHEKSFKQQDVDPRDPIKIVSLFSENKSVSVNQSFEGSADWLKTSKIQLKNVSDKDVVYVALQFNFPETTSSGNEMSYRAELGNKPGLPVANAPFLLKANDEVTFSFTDEEYRSLVKFVGYRSDINVINKTELRIYFVVFDDLTAWATGLTFKQDPNNPRRWLPIKN